MSWLENQNLVPNWWEKDKVEMSATRDGFGKGLVRAGEDNPNVVVLCGDLTESTRAQAFAEKFPDRFFEVGVAEQNMTGIASGLAYGGKIPIITSYAMFCPGRAWEPVRTLIAYPNLNAKICGAHAGVSVGPDGATHQATEDMAIMRCLPNMKVVAACDAVEAEKAVYDAITNINGPVYLRFAREKSAVFTTERTPYQFGKAQILREGKDVSIFACTPLVYEAMLAARALEALGIDVELINSPTVKPLDRETLVASAQKTGAVVTVEEHQRIGGFGSAVCEMLAETHPVAIERIGVDDCFGESGEPDELLEKFGLKEQNIIEKVKKIIGRKKLT